MVKFSGLPDPLEPRRLRERALPFVVLYGVALLLRVAYAWIAAGPGTLPSSDSLEYDQVAWNLATGAGFSLGEGLARHPTAFVPPVVPWLFSFVYRAVGHDYFAAVLTQCAVGALVPLLVVRLGTPLFGGRVGWIAGGLAAVHPLLVFFSAYLLTETTFCVVLLWAMIASLDWVRTPDGRQALLAGFLWGLAALTRPTALPLPLLTIAWGWIPLGLMLDSRSRRKQALTLLLGVIVVVGPWTLRNAGVFRAFVPVTTGGGRALLDSNNPQVWNDPALRGGAYLDRSAEPYASMVTNGSEPELDARARHAAWSYILSRPGQWPGIAWAKVARFWRFGAEGGGTGAWQREGSPLGGLLRWIDPLLLWSIVVMPFAVWGFVRALQGARRWFQSYPAWVIAFFTALAVLFWGSLRLRLPIEPLVLILAGVGFEHAWRKWRTRRLGLV